MKKQSLLFMGIVLFFSLLASWWYFLGTPFILGLDYFTHLSDSTNWPTAQGFNFVSVTPLSPEENRLRNTQLDLFSKEST